jgi:putative serine protease PepD
MVPPGTSMRASGRGARTQATNPQLTSPVVERSDWADDDGPFHQPLPPEDRLWRHPSEMAAASVSDTPPATGGAGARGRVLLAFGAGAIGAMLATAGVMLLLTGGDSRAGTSAAAPFAVPATTMAATTTLPAPIAVATTVAAATTLAPPAVDQRGLVRLLVTTATGQRAIGAVAVDANTLVTTMSAVRDATSLMAMLPDGTAVPAALLAVDTDSGAAVLSMSGPTDEARTGRAGALARGSTVWPAGTPSAKARVIGVGLHTASPAGETMRHVVAVELPDGLQLPEGEALLDAEGAVVGLCTRDSEGRTVAVPIELARGAARSVVRDGRITLPWVGVRGRDSEQRPGALVQEVQPDTPAQAAGLLAGDVVVTVDGQPITSMSSLVLAVRDHVVGDTVALRVVRADDELTVLVTLAERPPGV